MLSVEADRAGEDPLREGPIAPLTALGGRKPPGLAARLEPNCNPAEVAEPRLELAVGGTSLDPVGRPAAVPDKELPIAEAADGLRDTDVVAAGVAPVTPEGGADSSSRDGACKAR